MNANDVIESFVTEVALRLPRKQRNDVAFELRALLNEDLQARAGDAGREADAAMATELVREFGAPAEVAARYRTPLTIIDPEDGPAFLRATIIGLAIIWGVGLLRLRAQVEGGMEFLRALAQWWSASVLPSPWWPGLLVLGFGGAAWMRRRHPQNRQWKPRPVDRIPGSRATLVLGLIGIVCGVYVLLDPTWLLDVFWNGRAAPAAYEALTYTDAFRQRQGPFVLVLLLLNVPLLIAVIAKGRWSPLLRRIELVLGLALCAAMLWTALDGPVFLVATADRTAKSALVAIVALSLIGMGIKQYRRVKPSPA